MKNEIEYVLIRRERKDAQQVARAVERIVQMPGVRVLQHGLTGLMLVACERNIDLEARVAELDDGWVVGENRTYCLS